MCWSRTGRTWQWRPAAGWITVLAAHFPDGQLAVPYDTVLVLARKAAA
jgi:hypothetical protein